MPKIEEIDANFEKKYGSDVGGKGAKLAPAPRTPTGYFSFDLASNGGLPMGAVTIVYGPEGCCKTTFALRVIAEYQERHPDSPCAYFDVEGAVDPVWATKLGVNVGDLRLYRPSYAEACADMMVDFLEADDAGVVVLDSVAALHTTMEAEKSVEDTVMAGQARIMSRTSRKVTTRLIEARQSGYFPTVIYINQNRANIGVMFGDPDRQPGGHAIRYQAGMIVRLYAKNEVDKKVSEVLPAWKKVSAIIKKWKTPILATHSVWFMAGVDHSGVTAGHADNWSGAREYLEHYGILVKSEKKGWDFLGDTYPTLKECRERFLADDAAREYALGELLKKMVDGAGNVGFAE